MEHNIPHSAKPDWVSTLRDKGLRATSQRISVLNFLENNPHSSAENIFQGVRSLLPTISVQAVHLIVQDLTINGLIRRISLPGSSSAMYETRIDDNHHHVQCVQCGRTEDVDCIVGNAPCLDPSHAHGMRILEASVVFNAICKECEEKTLTDQNSINSTKEN